MAKASTSKTPTEEPKMQLSFLKFAKEFGPLPGKLPSKGDPLSVAKGAILKGLDEQKHYLSLIERGEGLPKTKGGKKSISTWFSKNGTDYWASVRYGQLTIKFDGHDSVRIGEASEVHDYYDAVKEAIRSGELDEIIGRMQKTRSASLTGRTGRKPAN